MKHRTPMKQATGLGSAKSGSHHWWAHRVSAIALIPLSIWFLLNALAMVGMPYVHVVSWMRDPLTAPLLSLFILTLTHHSDLGVQVVIEDYVPGHRSKLIMLLLNHFLHWLLAAVAVYAVLRTALGGVGDVG